MRFSQLIKTIQTDKYKIIELQPTIIQAQYNPDRFKFWKRAVGDSESEE